MKGRFVLKNTLTTHEPATGLSNLMYVVPEEGPVGLKHFDIGIFVNCNWVDTRWQ